MKTSSKIVGSFLSAMVLTASLVAGSTSASASIPLPPGGPACDSTFNNTTVIGSAVPGGDGKGAKGVTRHGDATFTSCMKRVGSKVTISIHWKTPGGVNAGTFNGYAVDCTTKKFHLITRLAYDKGTKKTSASKTSSATIKTSHLLKPVFDPEGQYRRRYTTSTEGLIGYMGLKFGSRGTGLCI